jgi:hypothetical protein
MAELKKNATQPPISFPGVNGMAVCDCGSTHFRVGIGADHIGSNNIRCIECVDCQRAMAVPFFHNDKRR